MHASASFGQARRETLHPPQKVPGYYEYHARQFYNPARSSIRPARVNDTSMLSPFQTPAKQTSMLPPSIPLLPPPHPTPQTSSAAPEHLPENLILSYTRATLVQGPRGSSISRRTTRRLARSFDQPGLFSWTTQQQSSKRPQEYFMTGGGIPPGTKYKKKTRTKTGRSQRHLMVMALVGSRRVAQPPSLLLS